MLTITATDLPRYIACNPSIFMEGFNPTVMDDTARDEGNAAHWLIQQVHSGASTAEKLVDQKAYNGFFITAEMVENVESFLSDIGRGGFIEYETSFKCPSGRWQINSRADHVKYDAQFRTLYVDDFKYGWGIVEVENNWTLIAHACGFMSANPDKPVDKIVFTIFQPRPHHPDGKVRRWVINEVTLQSYYAVLSQTLSNPSNILQSNDHCGKCPAATNCPAFRKAQMNAIDASNIAFNDKLGNDTLPFMIDTLTVAKKRLEKALDAYEELAMHRLRNGEIMDGYMIEQELTNRVMKDFVTIELVEIATGRTDLTKKTLITPNQMEKAGVPKEFVASICERRNKGAKLVRISADKRARKLFEQPPQ